MSVCLRSCFGAVLPCPGTLNHIRASVPQCPHLQNGDIEGAGIPSSLCVMIWLVADSCQGLDRGEGGEVACQEPLPARCPFVPKLGSLEEGWLKSLACCFL